MANAGAIKAGRAYVEVFADRNPLVRGLKLIKTDLKRLGTFAVGVGKTLAIGGAALGAPLVAAVKTFADTGSELTDMSARTGASVEALSSLGFAAGQTGASMEDVEKAMRFMAKSGNFAGQSTEQAFRGAMAHLAAIPDDMFRAEEAMRLFGKSGTALLPMAAEMAALEARARELGIVMSGKDAAAADALGDAWGELLAVGKALVMNVGAVLAPGFQGIIETLIELAAETNNWIQANRETIDSIMTIFTSGEVLWAALKLGWTEGVTALQLTWVGFLNTMVQAGATIAVKVTDVFINMFADLVKMFLRFEDNISGFLSKASGVFGMGKVDLIDNNMKAMLETMTNGIGLGVKAFVGQKITGFAGNFQAGSQTESDRLRAELDAARAEFAETHQRVQEERKAKAPKARQQQVEEAMAASTSVAGTFSAAAARGIATGGRLDEIADATKQTAKHTKKLAQQPAGLLVS